MTSSRTASHLHLSYYVSAGRRPCRGRDKQPAEACCGFRRGRVPVGRGRPPRRWLPRGRLPGTGINPVPGRRCKKNRAEQVLSPVLRIGQCLLSVASQVLSCCRDPWGGAILQTQWRARTWVMPFIRMNSLKSLAMY